MEPVPWSEIEGGRERVVEAFERIEAQATKMQTRFSKTLDSIGPAGMAAWDPIAGTVELRGKQFHAQMLGSFDGHSWLWSWANEHLDIPEELTAYARGLRDRFGAAWRTPLIEADGDEELPPMLGAIAIASGFGEAFYYANQSQVYLLVPGQLDDVKSAPPAKPARFATCFSQTRRTIADVVAHLRGDEHLKTVALVDDDRATLVGKGIALAIRRRDRLRDVLAEIKTLPPRAQDLARGAATAFVVEASVELDVYAETTYTITQFGAYAPSEVFAGRGSVPWQVIRVCERLNKLDRVVLFDTLLNDFYPRTS